MFNGNGLLVNALEAGRAAVDPAKVKAALEYQEQRRRERCSCPALTDTARQTGSAQRFNPNPTLTGGTLTGAILTLYAT